MSTQELLEVLDLTSRRGRYHASTASGSDRPNLHGGVVAAQALRAGHLSVGLDRLPHSMHAYFLQSGRFGEPVETRVAATRDGRSFSTRHIEVHQRVGCLLTMVASYQVAERGDDFGPPAAAVPAPTAGTVVRTGRETGMAGQGPFDLVELPALAGDGVPAPLRFWARTRDRLPEDPGLHACALVAMGGTSAPANRHATPGHRRGRYG